MDHIDEWIEEKLAEVVVKDDPNPRFFRELDNDVIDYFSAENGFLWTSEVSTRSKRLKFSSSYSLTILFTSTGQGN